MTIEDDLAIPAFLRRQPGAAKVNINHIMAQPWAPIRGRGEGDMAKINAAIVNRAATVTVYKYVAGGGEPEFVRNFEGIDEFERWYSPKVHRLVPPVNSQKDYTDILLEITGKAPEPVVPPKPKATKDVSDISMSEMRGDDLRKPTKADKPVKVFNLNGKEYLDMRHIRQLVAAGFKRTGTSPAVYTKGKLVVTFPLPAPGHRWSSSWEASDGRSGKGVKALVS